MPDWSHQEIDWLLNDIKQLELIDPEEVGHPSQGELDAYVRETLSLFTRTALEKHFEVCEQCTAYLSEAFDRDIEDRKVLKFDRPKNGRLRWLALAAASWAMPMLGAAWIFHQAATTPVTVETQPTRAVFSLARLSETEPGESLDEEAVSLSIAQKVNAVIEEQLRNFEPTTVHSSQPAEGNVFISEEELENEFNRRSELLAGQLMSQLGSELESRITRALNSWTARQPVVREAASPGHVPNCRPSSKTSNGPYDWAGGQRRTGP